MTENTAKIFFNKSKFSKNRTVEHVTECENGFIIYAPSKDGTMDSTFYVMKNDGDVGLYFPPRDAEKLGEFVKKRNNNG